MLPYTVCYKECAAKSKVLGPSFRSETTRVLANANEPLSMLHVETAYILVLAVFCVDLFVPLGAGIPFFYVVPVAFLALWSSPKQSLMVMGIAAVSSILIGVGFLLSPPGDFWYAVTNRSYALIVLGATVLLLL